MSDRKHMLSAVAGALLLLLLGGIFVVWPSYRETAETRLRIAELKEKVEGLASQTELVERLAYDLNELKTRMELDLKHVPATPDIAGLMRRLSLPVDGRTVLDQTFTAGSPFGAANDETFTEQAMPLTVDMEADFDSVFAMIRVAELMDRLVRVSSIRMVAERGDNPEQSVRLTGAPILASTIGLEVIYDPPQTEEDN